MFQSLSEKLENAFKKFKNKGKLTEADVKAGMREIKLALLEADVNFKVVRDFIKVVSERAVGAEVLESLLPAQQIVKIVNEELTNLMGGSQAKLTIASKPPTVVMMVGLQGAGKRLTRERSPVFTKSKASIRCSLPAIYTAPQPSSSFRSLVKSLIFPYSLWVIRLLP